MSKKSKIIGIIAIAVAVVALTIVGSFILFNQLKTGNILGVSWYNAEGTEFEISTVEEFYEFSKLSTYYDFKDQVVKLDADIVINKGNALDWAEKKPERKWTAIKGFAGTFDGQGHTISGVYAKSSGTAIALFVKTKGSSHIKNFSLKNSYFEGRGFNGVASIACNGGGNFSKIYSDAYVILGGKYSGYAAGIASTVMVKASFSECWYDGVIKSPGRENGGIVDTIQGGTTTVSHCLFTGEIESTWDLSGSRTGGIVGSVVTEGSGLVIEDSLSTGTLNTKHAYLAGSIIGNLMSGTSLKSENTYGSEEVYQSTIGTAGSNGTINTTPLPIQGENLVGVKAYQWTNLDFTKHWAVVEEGTPILKCFAKTVPSLEGVSKAFDVSWYDENASEGVITTAEQLYGFYVLSGNTNFKDKTVKLGADIVVNEGNAQEWKENEPENKWFTIQSFFGNFDGQGHTISGLYYKGDVGGRIGLFGQTATTSVIKNASIKNSYFAFTGTGDVVRIGSFVGQGRGVFDTLYSDAILENGGQRTGGIVGEANFVNDKTQTTITNCWFDGEINIKRTGVAGAGGIVGLVENGGLVIEHCLNTGNIHSDSDATGSGYVGGIIGRVSGTSKAVNIADSLNVGLITANGATTGVRAILGQRSGINEGVSIKYSYATTESCELGLYANWGGNQGWSTDNVKFVRASNLLGIKGYQYTLLDFENYWAAIEGKQPVLKSFVGAEQVLNTKGYERTIDTDTSWINNAKGTKDNPYVIKTAEELYGLAKLVNEGNNFKDKYIKIAADIRVNSGKASDWSKVEPFSIWNPIGSTSNPFAGTLDGQGHTISGLYNKIYNGYIGFFGYTESPAVIRNLKLTNSYFETERDADSSYMGSFAGRGSGTFDTLYSDAILYSKGQRTGGIVGETNKQTTDKAIVTNCWYAGTLTAAANRQAWAGGIVGSADHGSTEISHCLNTGTLHTNAESDVWGYLGGIIGRASGNTKTVVVNDCLNTGLVTSKGAKDGVRAILGQRSGKSESLTIKNCYALTGSCEYGLHQNWGSNTGWKVENVKFLSDSQLKGINGYKFTFLDFKTYWGAVDNKVPQLLSFTDKKLVLNTDGIGREIIADSNWMGSANGSKKDPYTISDAADLYGFAQSVLSGNSFEDKYIELKKDIIVNDGVASTWASEEPVNIWTPIGNTDSKFAGTFDGNGHTISGLYLKTNTGFNGLFGYTDAKSKIQNTKLTNSYFAVTSNKDSSRLGSFVGRGSGTLKNLYSEAILYSEQQRIGGIIGEANTSATTTMVVTNCWYNGTLTAASNRQAWSGGIVGVVDTGTIEISHCLNTGTLHSNAGSGVIAYFGGILGRASGSIQSAKIKDCLNTGSVTVNGAANGMSAILGQRSGGNKPVSIKNCYAKEGSSIRLYENWGYAEGWLVENVNFVSEANLKGINGYKNTTLDFTTYWAAVPEKTPQLISFTDEQLALSINGVNRTIVADSDWMDGATGSKEDPYLINDAEDLYGFAQTVLGGKDFKGEYVALKNNITVNWGTASEWANTAPMNSWTPIGNGTYKFNGTFDGQGHIISGLYSKTSTGYNALFGFTDTAAVIKNAKLTNTYFAVTQNKDGSRLGSFVGRGCGTLENLYSEAILYSEQRRIGGIIGEANSSATTSLIVTECWFAGKLTAASNANSDAGGIVGLVDTGALEISHCLNTGTLYTGATSANRGDVSGILGRVSGGAKTVKINDCLHSGSVTSNGATTSVNAILGIRSGANESVTISKCYAKEGSSKNLYTNWGGSTGWKVENVSFVSEANLKGTNAINNTALDFEKYWEAIENDMPMLKAFLSEKK